MTAREQALKALKGRLGAYDANGALGAIEAAGLRIVDDAELDELCAQRAAQAGALWPDRVISTGTPIIRRGDVVGGRFHVRGQGIHTPDLEKELGAWMVHLPSGVGAACADASTYLQNSVACVRALQTGLAAMESAR